MLIKVKKIRRSKAKTNEGGEIPNPLGGDVELKEDQVVEEAININSIKSVRPFRSDGQTHRNVTGEMCVIYLYSSTEDEVSSDKRRRRTPEIHVVANYEELVKQINELKSKG